MSLEAVDPVFAGTFDQESLFFQCGHEVLTGLHQTLANEPISLMLTDADGLVLNRLSGDTSLVRALDDVHLAPGFSYAEREAGTNGLGLALADRSPTLVRADEHYSASLCTYTCAAAPVLDPLTGRLEGAVNITTWSSSSNDLLLALAQSAASNTSALMLARSTGRRPRPAPAGQVFRVEPARLEPGSGTVVDLSAPWTHAVDEAARAMSVGRLVAAVGEPASGRSTLLAQAARRVWPRDRVLSARAPRPTDVEAWMSLWSPELGKPHTVVIVGEVDTLPAWAVERLRDLVTSCGHPPVSVTAEGLGSFPSSMSGLVGAVVPGPPLRERSTDVVPLARYAAARVRGRDVAFTPGRRARVGVVWVAGERGPADARRSGCGGAVRGRRRPTPPGRGAERVAPAVDADRGVRARRDRPLPLDAGGDGDVGGDRPGDEQGDDLPQDRAVRDPPLDRME